MVWWFVQGAKAKDISGIQNANAAQNVGVLVSLKKKRKIVTKRLKVTILLGEVKVLREFFMSCSWGI